MKNKTFLYSLLAVLMSMCSVKSFAHDIEVQNADGVTIYYSWRNFGTELAVSYYGDEEPATGFYSGEIIIPESVEYGGHTYKVTAIYDCAFTRSSTLTSVTIPNSVTFIDERAFDNCRSLNSITIPNSVISIGSYAFSGTAWYNNQPDGLVYAGKVAYTYKGEMPANTQITLKEGTLGIADDAFSGCSNLTSITIPKSVISIGCSAFQNCSSLTSIMIPNSVTTILDHAFRNCTSLTSITVPNSVTSIGINAFLNTAWYDNQPEGMVYAGKVAYTYKGEMPNNTQIALKEGTLGIAEGAFYGCRNLTSITIPNSVTNIGYIAFSQCSGLTSVTIPKSVTAIDNYAFNGCSDLSNIVSEIDIPFKIYNSVFNGIPPEVQLIVPKGTKATYQTTEGWDRFSNIVEAGDDSTISGQCGDKLYYTYDKTTNTLTISGEGPMWEGRKEWYNWPWGTFRGDIQYVKIEFGVTSIGWSAFDGCGSLTSIIIPNSVKSIEWTAFAGCSELTSITLPESLDYVNENAFEDCNKLVAVHISNLEAFLNIWFRWGDYPSNPLYFAQHLFLNGEEIVDLVIPNGVTSIKQYAFINGSSIKSVYIPSSVKSIEVSAFSGCSSLATIESEIDKPFKIDHSVFNGIPSDAQLIVPKGTKTAYQATDGWNRFTNIVEAGGTEPELPSQIHIDGIYYKVTESGEAEVVSAENGVTNITIPSTVSYNNTSYKVMSIAKDAFENCEQLSAVIWEPEVQFNAKVNNPNFLLYVSDEKYASRSVKNVVVNGVAESIELTDAANGNDFYCPRAFKARSIVYSHNYQMETGIGDSRGWETIVLPFDVQKYTHATKGELESFTTWSKGSSKKPFWLFELTASGYKDVAGIKANTPYIISMPNNQQYEQQYQIPGVVTFSALNVEVQKSDNLKPGSYQGRSLVPNYMNKDGGECLPLNVNNYYVTNSGKDISGSKFVRGLRAVHPFEAYMTTTDNTRSIDVMDGLTTAIRGIQMVKDEASTIKVYDTRGVLMKTATSMDDVKKGLKAGVYIVNGKKMIIK